MRCFIVLLALACAQCAQASGDSPPTETTGRTKYHMRQHIDDLRTVERMLIDGKLEDAKILTHFLRQPSGMRDDSAEEREVTFAVAALARSRTIEEAIRSEVRIATACASCHQRMQKLPVFVLPSKAPADDATVEAQMARHQWAVDRLWEGLIGASDTHWRAGLYVIATSSLPRSKVAKPALATKLQDAARGALDVREPLSLDERANVYGDLLITCAGCHSQRADKRRR
jgi:cytochrome c553